MKNNNIEEIPVYMFLGFLESGKTTFASETLIERGFTEGEPTLLLVCEEGIEEYDEEYLESNNIKYIECPLGSTVCVHSGPYCCGLVFMTK